MEAKTEERNERKVATGRVVSDKMEKTITVQVERLERHPKYKKYVRRYTKLYAHDEKREAKAGDIVRIASTRPLSRLKRWRLIEVVSKAKRPEMLAMEPEQVIASLTAGAAGGKKP